jgi:hypothetical protein
MDLGNGAKGISLIHSMITEVGRAILSRLSSLTVEETIPRGFVLDN